MSESSDGKKMHFVSDKDKYLWAFISFKSGIDVIDNLNEQYSKILDVIAFSELTQINITDFQKGLEEYGKKLHAVSEEAKKEDLHQVYVPLKSDDAYEKIFYQSIVRNMSKNIIADMSLVYTVALFEDYLQKILRITFNNKPETLKTCQKSVSYEDLLEFGDIEKAKESIVEKELLVVNEDIEDIKAYIDRKFKIDISEFIDWKQFKEPFYRRNIIVHNSGIPNQLYRAKTGYVGENVRLTVSKEYLKILCPLFTEMAFKIGLAFEKKLKEA